METTRALARSLLAGAQCDSLRAQLLSYLTRTNPADILLRYHPLGFLDLPLDTDSIEQSHRLDVRATMHIWHPGVSRPADHLPLCHAHGWELRSTVLEGTIGNQEFEVEEPADGGYPIYSISYEEDVSISTRTARGCHASRSSVARYYSRGDTYLISGSTYHTTVLDPASIVITAMVSNNRTPSIASTVHVPDTPAEIRYRRTVLAHQPRGRVIRDLVHRLAGSDRQADE